jgi:hypothetical protein
MKRPGVIALLSIACASSAAAQSDSTIGRTLVVDSVNPRAPVHSLSELLTSRLPGVLVWSSSGTVGTTSRILMRGPNTIVGTGTPLVMVDGMVVDASETSFLPYIGGQQVSRLDDLDPADIASVQVLDGASTEGPFGTGAASGVLVINTRRGETGPPRFRFSSSQGLSSDPHTFPASFTPAPGGLPQANALEDPATSPFRSGYVRDFRGELSGGWAPATYYLSAHWEGVGGVYGLPDAERSRLAAAGTLHPEDLNPNNLSRLNLHAASRISLGNRADVEVSGGLLSSSLRLPSNDNSLLGVLGNGELASPSGPSPWAFFPPGDLFQVVTTDDVLRATGTVNAEWRPAEWLQFGALAGHELVRQEDGQLQRNGEGPAFGADRQGVVEQDTVLQGGATYRITARARAGWGRNLALTTAVGFEVRRMRVREVQLIGRNLPPGSTSFADASQRSFLLIGMDQTTSGFSVDEQADWDGRVQGDVGLRGDRSKVLGLEPPVTTYPHVALSWLPLGKLRLRVSWGRAGNYALAASPTPEITSEVEGGADAVTAGGAVHLSVTGYARRTHVNNLVATPGGPEPIVGTIENTGVILATDLRLLRTSRLDWEAQLGLWGNRNRTMGFPVTTNIGTQRIESGYPLASYFSRRIVGYNDANADGIIQAGEVQVSSTVGFAGNPFPTQGAMLGTSLRIGDGVRATLLMEYRAGNQLLDQTEELRCQERLCAGVDTRAPLSEQAAAAVAGTVDAPFVSTGAFLKIRELTVSIAAPPGWTQRVGCRAATLTLAGRNLLTWTGYRGLDPEVSSTGATGLGVFDLFTQPPVRTVAARVDLAF